MIRHILFWKLQEKYTAGPEADAALNALRASVETLRDIPGLLRAEIGPNLAGGDYGLVFYAEFADAAALEDFREHPLHVAHRERCAPYVTGRLAGDLETAAL